MGTLKEPTAGLDLSQYPASAYDRMKRTLNCNLKSVDNLVDQIWTDRPERPKNPIHFLEMIHSGEDALNKYDNFSQRLNANSDLDLFLVTALDEIAWLLNLRGSDIDFNPVFFSFLVFDVNDKKVYLYIDAEKVEGLDEYLEHAKIS